MNENNQLGLAAVCLGHYVMDSQVPNAVRPKLDHWSFVELTSGYVNGAGCEG